MTGMPDERARSAAASLRRPLIVGGLAVLIAVVPFLSGLVGSLILYAITRKLHLRLIKLVPPRASAVAITLGVCCLLLVPGTWLVSTIASEGTDALRSLRGEDVASWFASTPFGGSDVTKEIAGSTTAIVGWISTRAIALVGSVTSTILNILLALLGLYYLLIDAPSLWIRIKRIAGIHNEIADLLVARFGAVTDALILGSALTAVLQGTVVGVAFALVGLRPAILWGFVTACVSVVPVLGSALVWLPGVVVLLLTRHFGGAALLAVLGGGLASNLDNLVRPLVYRRVSGVHPMVTLVGVFAGIRTLGVIGAFIGPLVLSCFIELLGVYEDAGIVADDIGPRTPSPLESQHV